MQINRAQLEYMWDSCLDIGAFAGAGYLSSHIVNWFVKWASIPSFLTKAGKTSLKSATVCCALFTVIDRLVHTLLGRIIKGHVVNKPIYSVLRIGVSATATIGLFNFIAQHLGLANVGIKPAFTIILTAIAVYSQMMLYLERFNARYEEREEDFNQSSDFLNI